MKFEKYFLFDITLSNLIYMYNASFPNIVRSSKNYLKIVSNTSEEAKKLLINNYEKIKKIKDINKFYNTTEDIYENKLSEIEQSYTRIANTNENYDKCLDIIKTIISTLNTKETVNIEKYDSNFEDNTQVYADSKSLLDKLYSDYNKIKSDRFYNSNSIKGQKDIYNRAKRHIKFAKMNLEKSKKQIDEFKETMDKIISIVRTKKFDTKLSTLAKYATNARQSTLLAKRKANEINEDEEDVLEQIQSLKDLQFSPNSGGKTTRKKRRNNRRSRKFRGGYSLNSGLIGMANFPISNGGGVNLPFPPQSSFA